MWGIFDADQADDIIPEGHRRPHFKHGDHPIEGVDGVETSWDGTVGGTYDDTPEDHPDGAAPARRQAQRPLPRARQAQASLRLQPFGGAAEQA